MALCFSWILFHKCKLIASCRHDKAVQCKEIFNMHQQSLSFIFLIFCNLTCNFMFVAPCTVHFKILLLATTQNLVFQNINPLSRRSINHHPAAKVNANNIQIYSTLKTMVLATPSHKCCHLYRLRPYSFMFSRNFKECFILFGFDLHVLVWTFSMICLPMHRKKIHLNFKQTGKLNQTY